MIICVCNSVTEDEIRQQCCQTLSELKGKIAVCDQCECCEPYIKDILDDPNV